MIHPAMLPEADLERECKLSFRRASGPGGQNRNKVETAVALTHLPSGLTGQASERRTQGENRQTAMHRLRLLLAISIRTPPSEIGQSTVSDYVKNGRLAISTNNEQWPAVLAEILNLISEHQWQLGPVADQLNTTASQLVRAVAKEPAAFTYLNDGRRTAGLAPLKP